MLHIAEDEIADAVHFTADVVIPGTHFSERIGEGNIEGRRHADTHDVVSVFLPDVGVQHDVRRHTDIGHDAACLIPVFAGGDGHDDVPGEGLLAGDGRNRTAVRSGRDRDILRHIRFVAFIAPRNRPVHILVGSGRRSNGRRDSLADGVICRSHGLSTHFQGDKLRVVHCCFKITGCRFHIDAAFAFLGFVRSGHDEGGDHPCEQHADEHEHDDPFHRVRFLVFVKFVVHVLPPKDLKTAARGFP